jgi:hypothetical protein
VPRTVTNWTARPAFAKNPCAVKNGGCSHVCEAVNGKVVCKCPPEYELIDKTCFQLNPCLSNNGGCSHTCINNRGNVKCSCPPGYKLNDKICIRENPCARNNGGCSHKCGIIDGQAHCFCPSGYILRPNKLICKEINECQIRRGGCSHGCKNLPGSYQCTCPNGFRLGYNNKTCVDVNECLENNGNCQVVCKNFRGGYKCACNEGYVLQEDGRSCKAITFTDCRVPAAPEGGIIRCINTDSDKGNLVPVGTKCMVWCNEGYKLVGDSMRICQSTGIWGSSEPYCVCKCTSVFEDLYQSKSFSRCLSQTSSDSQRMAHAKQLQSRIHLLW